MWRNDSGPVRDRLVPGLGQGGMGSAPILAVTLVGYGSLTQVVKMLLLRNGRI